MAVRLLKLLGALGVLAFVWLLILPWFARRPGTAAYLEWLDREKIDPSAMYYTELEMMEPIFTRLALEQRGGAGKAGASREGAGPGKSGATERYPAPESGTAHK